MNHEMEWREDYNVGCEYVDNAHRKLFSVIRKLEALCRDEDIDKNRFACEESIKFLYNYTMTHFSQEEAFMREVGYVGYTMHKHLHDTLREKTLPQLESKLIAENYSIDTVTEFIGVFVGWLTGHILVEDQAITGKAVSLYNLDHSEGKLDALRHETERVLKSFTGPSLTVVSDHYKGEAIADALYYEMKFETVRVLFIAQNQFIFNILGEILGNVPTAMTKDVLYKYVQLADNFIQPALAIYKPDEVHKDHKKQVISAEQVKTYFSQEASECSIEWKTKYGLFAICILEEKPVTE